MSERGTHTWPDGLEALFGSSCPNANPERSVDGRPTQAGRASIVPIAIFLLVAVALIALYGMSPT